jgi:anti-sigma B factor antagonist
LVDVLKDSPEEIALDLADLSYVDSTGLSLFVSTTKRVRTSGKKLVLQNPGANARRLLEVTSLTEYFSIE